MLNPSIYALIVCGVIAGGLIVAAARNKDPKGQRVMRLVGTGLALLVAFAALALALTGSFTK
ncbi:hypothetical protein E6C70_09685 [Glaciibacter flavus]|uniref:Uncharacterized protein n=1 Tax=Orlajensenia flava TaxID=2565934 RepID=A0A4S4FXT1_9MICO|nr:hypothetical protein [Glaciibacter flavus]THG34516.1 hypothetical protein E6C70_09685 [Glaciibacter flavus]